MKIPMELHAIMGKIFSVNIAIMVDFLAIIQLLYLALIKRELLYLFKETEKIGFYLLSSMMKKLKKKFF